MNFKDQLAYRFKQLNQAEKLILVNVACFVMPLFIRTVFYLFNIPSGVFVGWFELSADWGDLIFKPWTILTYSFMHSGFFHLFWNMYLLYFTSRLFLNIFPARMFFNVYFLGVILGGITFLISYSIFPAFQNSSPIMVGASAGVMATFIFIANYSPDLEVRLIFFNVKLRYLAIAFILLDIIQIPYGNAGGHLAHLGGAALGYFYFLRLNQGTDIGLPLEELSNRLLNLFKKQSNLKTVYKNKSNAVSKKKESNEDLDQQKIDAILDKISKSGYESLSQKEKDFLFRAGKNN
ncbi:MAG: rhomboid family intramembrane serine protease [Flavobacteriaceae bacterium]|nr:rhomboid family intramembrane serine protease [Flavobacteriaceae bacterium]